MTPEERLVGLAVRIGEAVGRLFEARRAEAETLEKESRGGQVARRRTHYPETAGSNPAPATRKERP